MKVKVLQDGSDFYVSQEGPGIYDGTVVSYPGMVKDDRDMAGAVRARAKFLVYAAANGWTVRFDA